MRSGLQRCSPSEEQDNQARTNITCVLADLSSSYIELKPLTSDDRLSPGNIVRAVHCNNVLRHWGYIFEQSFKPTGDIAEQLFAVSFPVHTINHFFSHSWSASRLGKWGAIARLHLEKWGVMIALGFWLSTTTCLYALRKSTGSMSFIASFTLFVVIPVLLLGITFSGGHACLNATTAFLDKICIHQANEEMKMAGVVNLGSFVEISENLVVLWSDDYFERLWCVFEIAVFGSRRSAKDMMFLPLWLGPFLYGMLAVNVLVMLIASLLQSSEWLVRLMDFWGFSRGTGMFWVIANLLPAIANCAVLRLKVKKHRRVDDVIRTFHLESTKVTVESDRLVVYDRIRNMFKSMEEFELFVRSDLRENVFQALGAVWDVPYWWGLIIFLPYLLYGSADTFAISKEGYAAQGVPSWNLYMIVNMIFYTSCWLLLPFALKATGISTFFTSRLPLLVALPIDVFIHLTVLFSVTTLSWHVVLFLVLGFNDETVLQPLHNVTVGALFGF